MLFIYVLFVKSMEEILRAEGCLEHLIPVSPR